ncbi:MFS transporter [Mucilaginibacter sp. L3T2-6]|uniref:MFS transporter n=1 Tax=Mucilaginibacter sp. L3T2-6 TaxID=3062491 RepID=UPI0026758712|nr:MFS transporter [Mucilaginibacter sp. L3T2-6]MDO3643197.1 MFS transporter [Mucilaginibacter sp. L3T2-6]MDV6215521.1 MFS transporter [Mucilaginibacter sp. L3T2-6]
METLTLETVQPKQLSPAKLAALFVICFVSSALGGAISTLMSVYLPVVVKELQGNNSQQDINYLSGLINSLFIFGWAFGGFFWGIISDKIGRKMALVFAAASYGIFTILTGYMTGWGGVMVCRFMSGFGVGGDLVIAFTLVSEVWPQKTRAVYTGILSIAFPVGIFSAGVINVIMPSWRLGFLVGVIPVVLALLALGAIAESDLWKKHHSEKKASQASSGSLLSPGNRKAMLTGSLIFGAMLIGLWAVFSWLPTWIQSISVGDASKARGLSMMCMGMGGLAGGFFSGWLVNLMGLKRSMITCFMVCTVLSFILFKTNNTFSPIIYAEIALMALFFGASQGILSVYIPALFPTGVRSSATGICFNAGRLFTGTAVLFVGVLVTTLGGYGNSLFIFSLVFLIGLLITLFTKDLKVAA